MRDSSNNENSEDAFLKNSSEDLLFSILESFQFQCRMFERSMKIAKISEETQVLKRIKDEISKHSKK